MRVCGNLHPWPGSSISLACGLNIVLSISCTNSTCCLDLSFILCVPVSLHQPELLKSLSDILKHGGNSPVSRMQAGLQLKNAVYSKDLSVRAVHQQRWLQFPEEIRIHVKQNVSARFFDMLGHLLCGQFDDFFDLLNLLHCLVLTA